MNTSPWDDFRALCSYYISCVELGEKAAEYIKYKDGRNAYKIVMPDRSWFTGEEFFINEAHEDTFLFKNIRICNQQEERPYIGYPCQIIEGANSERWITPLFVIPLDVRPSVQRGRLHLCADLSAIKVNYRWIEYNIPRDEQKSFLNALYCSETGIVDFEVASSYLKNKYQMNFDLSTTQPYFDCNQETIQNVAILTTGLRLKYSKTLRRELEIVRDQSDEVLDATALAYIFRNPPLPNKYQEDVPDFPIDFLDIPDETGRRMSMNHQQRLALIDALSLPCTRIKGPPGTGKSHVAVNLLANLIFRGKTALFTSKNRKAIHAIDTNVSKLLANEDHVHLVQYCTIEEQPEQWTTHGWFELDPFSDKEKILKSVRLTEVTEDLYEDLMEELREMAVYWKHYSDVKEKEEGLLKLAEELALMSSSLLPQDVSQPYLSELIKILKRTPRRGIIGRLLDKLQKVEEKQREAVYQVKTSYKLTRSTPQALAQKLETECKRFQKRKAKEKDYDARSRVIAATCNQNELLEEIFKFQERINDKKEKLFLYKLSECIKKSTITPKDLAQCCAQLKDATKMGVSFFKEKVQESGKNAFQEFLKVYPVWVSTLLSLTKSSPCIPAVFDRVIIDEAAQCEVPPMIPALYRAKGVTIVGDDEQFPPIVDLTDSVHKAILKRHKIEDHFFALFDFTKSSIFSVLPPSESGAPLVELTEHFRCENDIIAYCNETFYGGKLNACKTPPSGEALHRRLGLERALSWINVKDSLDQEIDAAYNFLIKVADLSGEKPSIGIITPLKKIAEKASRRLDGIAKKAAGKDKPVVISTVNAFQGGECDIILIIFGYTSKLERGQRWYLEEEEHKYIYNVAVSRAKKCCILIGDQERLKESPVRHLRQIASYPKPPAEINTKIGPGEKILQTELEKLGLRPLPQYPLGTRFLDLVLEDSKIDIEVDGFTYHTNCYGRRNMSDYDRDNQVMHAGFKPYRVWHNDLMKDPQKIALEIFELHNKRLKK